jgi:F-type H+-transporting ATPase subunit delta
VPVPRKRATVDQLLAQAGLLPVVGKLLLLLAERDRLVLLPDLIAAYQQRLLDYRNVVRVEVTTALPLADAHAHQIEQSLARATGKTVQLSTRVDPNIVGGLVARVGSTVFDGSVTSQLQRMKRRLDQSL